MTVKKTLNSYINKHQNKIIVSLFITLGIVSVVFTSLLGMVIVQNTPSKVSEASGVYQCAVGETLSGTNCLSTAITSPIYTETCENGYTPMDSVCVTFTQRACTDYLEAVTDTTDPALCKIGNINNVLLSEVTDYDGRQCKGLGYNFKYYNVSLPLNSNTGPVICASAFSAVFGKANFRFIPRTITSIRNFVTIQTGTSTPTCASGYTLVNSQCSIPAKVNSCSSAGEYLDSSSSACLPCPVNKYCLNSTTGETTSTICPNGGSLVNNVCVAANKISLTLYTDGCNSGYDRYDLTCAIEEIRTHDLDCSYFYASDNENVLAIRDPNLSATAFLRCSTGGRTDFANTSIVKISDLQCDGPGTAWYSYNVAYDPLVCGNTYDVNNKAAFRWSEKTFTKIVGLQKIGSNSSVCPTGWVDVIGTGNCSQAPLIQRFALISDCPSGTFSPAGSDQASDCTSQPSTTTGGGIITITNQISSSSSVSSIVKPQCVLKANEYKEYSECKSCPEGTIVTSSNPMSIRDCITIVNVEKPTIRTGGVNAIQNLIFFVSIVFLIFTFLKLKKYHQSLQIGWFKVK